MAAATYKGPKELALQRHRKAKLLRTASIIAILIPICFFVSAGFQTPIWVVCIFLALARFLYLEFKSMKQAAVRAEKGGRAEDLVGDLLSELKESGWKIEKNVILPREGDVDFVATAPNQKVFAIDVKSHAGIITEMDRQLLRDDKPLERDIIAGVRRQAVLVSSQKGCGIVIPVIAFTRAKLSLTGETVDGVYVTKAHRLIETLYKVSGLPNNQIESNKANSKNNGINYGDLPETNSRSVNDKIAPDKLRYKNTRRNSKQKRSVGNEHDRESESDSGDKIKE